MPRVGMEVGQPPCAAYALMTARVASWSAWNPHEAFKNPVRYYAKVWCDEESALVAGFAYRGKWAGCDYNLGRRVASSESAVWITPEWLVASTTFMGGHFGQRMWAVAAPLIMDTDLVWWTMRLFWKR